MAETKELTNFHYISLTDKGCVRTNNEDYLGYFDTLNGHVFVVCDGVGGLPCGEKASQTVVNSVKFFFSNFYYKDPVQALSDALDYAQDRLADEVRNDRSCQGMATTVVLALVRYNTVYYAHMGDSRLYFLHNKELIRLTRDDSYVWSLVEEGKLSPKDAESHPRKNELTKALGLFPPCTPNICSKPIRPDEKDLILLCTDGLYNMISEKEIQSILSRRGHIEEKGMDMLKTAIKRGATDNISLQIIKFYNVDSRTTISTTQAPVAKTSQRKKLVIALEILLAVLFVVGIAVMRFGNRTQPTTERPTRPPQNYSINIKTDTTCNIDSVSLLYGVKIEDIVIFSKGGNYIMNIPVKKILKTRYYDNLATFERLYNTSRKRIMIVNNLTSPHISPGTTITIPF